MFAYVTILAEKSENDSQEQAFSFHLVEAGALLSPCSAVYFRLAGLQASS